MSEEKLITPPAPPAPPVEAPAPVRRWFIAGLLPNGTTVRQEADSPDSFLELASRAVVAWIDYRSDDYEHEFAIIPSKVGFSSGLISALHTQPPNNYEDLNAEMGFVFPAVRVKQFEVTIYRVLVLVRSNFILTVHPMAVDTRFGRLRRYSDTFLKRIPVMGPTEDKLTMALIRIIDENNDTNFQHLRAIDEQGDELNADLMNPKIPRDRLGPKIYAMKHALLVYMDALWETVDVLNTLRFGDADLITNDDKLLERIGVLVANVGRQIGLAEHMSDVLASGLEVLQSIYNNQLQMLNNRLALVVAYLTILGTALLVPNTIATVMGNSAFNLGPEDTGWYLTLIVVSTVVATAISFWWVIKRGWMPKKVD
jgi:magnesium transporter